MIWKRVLVLMAVWTFASSAFGMSAPIPGPKLAFPDGTTSKTMENVLNALRYDVTFVDGRFLNEYTWMRFSGSAEQVNRIIELLHGAGFQVRVGFADYRDDRVSFTLSQSDSPREVGLAINTAKKDFDLSKLIIRIPPTGSGAGGSTTGAAGQPPVDLFGTPLTRQAGRLPGR
ncbi:MAG: hypothetical protein H0U67_07565 [Gemmatimonadetes bacterium]|nr:hypothetical protein [Gemmatimonadota bacterium]